MYAMDCQANLICRNNIFLLQLLWKYDWSVIVYSISHQLWEILLLVMNKMHIESMHGKCHKPYKNIFLSCTMFSGCRLRCLWPFHKIRHVTWNVAAIKTEKTDDPCAGQLEEQQYTDGTGKGRMPKSARRMV